MQALRTAVSGKRKRYTQGGYNLDLTYITDRLIAMGFPASGVESTYRNKIDNVVEFLTERHGNNFLIINLSERPYDYSKFNNQVMEFGFPDHHAPPLDVLWAVCHCMDAWLSLDERNVAVVHCKAGKGRTGVVIGSYMLFSGLYANAGLSPKRMAQQSLQYFLSRRGEGVTYPSQKRYVEYFAEMLPVMRKQLATNDAPLPGVLPKGEAGAGAGAGSATGAGAGARTGAGAATTTGASKLAAGGATASAGASTSGGAPLKYWQFLGGILADKQSQHVMGAAALSRRSRGESLRGVAGSGSSRAELRATRSASPLTEGAASDYLRDAFRRIKGIKIGDMPLPPPRKFHLTTIIMSDVPLLPNGFRPVITVYTAPRQHGDSKVVYNTVWDNPNPPLFTQGQGCIAFQLKNCVVCGDVLIHCENMPGRELVWYVSFHTSFVTDDQMTGVWRLTKNDIDMEGRSKNIHRFMDGFFIDMVFDGSTVTADTEAPMTTDVDQLASPAAPGSSANTEPKSGGSAASGGAGGKKKKTALEKVNELSSTGFSRRTIDNVTMRNGWLHKQGGLIKNWKKRWFVLRNGALSYYRLESDPKPKGVVVLSECHGVTQCREGDFRGRPHCFRLSHKARTYFFQATSAQDLEDWVCMIALAIASAQPAIPPPAPPSRRPAEAPPTVPPSRSASLDRDLQAAEAASDLEERRRRAEETSAEAVALSRLVTEFYRLHNPAKCTPKHIRRVVQSYLGREAALWEDLGRKYPHATVPPVLPDSAHEFDSSDSGVAAPARSSDDDGEGDGDSSAPASSPAPTPASSGSDAPAAASAGNGTLAASGSSGGDGGTVDGGGEDVAAASAQDIDGATTGAADDSA